MLRIPGDEFRVRFHEQLTVLSGIGMLERQALADSVIGALTGATESTVMTLTDNTGRPVQLVSSAGRVSATYLDDGNPAPVVVGWLAPDAESLRDLMLVQAGDLGLVTGRPRSDEPAELIEARATLAELTTELQTAVANRNALEMARAELAEVEEQMRQAEDSTAQREYARVLGDLERVRAEASALQSGRTGRDGDRHLLSSADEARALADRWSEAVRYLAAVVARWGDAERFEPGALEQYAAIPDDEPERLGPLLDAWHEARVDRDQVDGRLRGLAASRLPDPSDPRVVDLATTDQRALWAARERVLAATLRLEAEQVALGGVSPRGAAAVVVDAIEASHSIVEAAEAVLRRRWVPTIAGSSIAATASLAATGLMASMALPFLAVAVVIAGVGLGVPYRRLVNARRHEQGALEKASAPTYLSFHLRRVDAAIDPAVRERLELAALEHRMAVTAWDEVANGIGLETAAAIEAEVLAYAAALGALGGAADEIENLRAELSGRAEPALAAARRAVVDLCAPYGLDAATIDVDDGALVDRLLPQQVALGRLARVQLELEEAEAASTELATRLDELLVQLGFGESDGTLDERVGAMDFAVGRATEREAARALARPRDQIEDDLIRLQAEARRLKRPEWASVTPKDADGPDVAELRERHEELLDHLSSLPRDTTDLELLADRHSSMGRRVAALESRSAGGQHETVAQRMEDIHENLLAHLTRATHAGPADESVPVLLDEPFLAVPAERKWELLDMLCRLGEKTQLVYLTDDPFVASWARRRAAAGQITLLEPIAEPA